MTFIKQSHLNWVDIFDYLVKVSNKYTSNHVNHYEH